MTMPAHKSAQHIANEIGLITLDHMTHLSNLENILIHGLHAHGNRFQSQDISNQAVNRRRSINEPIYNKPIHDYVPFYFNPRNAMLYKTQNDHGDLVVILGYSTELLDNAVITDGNAACTQTRFCAHPAFMQELDWKAMFSSSWCQDGYRNEELKRQMMAEALVPGPVGSQYLQSIFCASERIKEYITQHSLLAQMPHVDVVVKPELFFEL